MWRIWKLKQIAQAATRSPSHIRTYVRISAIILNFPLWGNMTPYWICSWLQLPQCTFEPWKHVILHKVYYDPHVAYLFTVLVTIFSVVFIFQCKKWQENLKQSILLVMKTVYQMLHSLIETYETYILLVCSIAVYFNESCNILASPKGKSKYKWQVKIYSDTIY